MILLGSFSSFVDLGSEADMEGAIAENPEERARCYLHQSKEQSPAELCMWKTVIKILTESTVGLISLRGKKCRTWTMSLTHVNKPGKDTLITLRW